MPPASRRCTVTNGRAEAGKPQVWLSVLVPFNEGEDAGKVAKRIKTRVDGSGTAMATIGRIAITIAADGSWQVKR